MNMTEEQWSDLQKKRSGWKPGSQIAPAPYAHGMTLQEIADAEYKDTPKAAAKTVTSFAGLKRTSSRAQSSRTAPGVLRRSRAAVLPKSLEVQRKQSGIEIILAQQIALLQLPAPKRNYLFMPGRRLELDFAWPERMIALEVQGMVHRIKGRFQADMEKRALALLAGWRILEVGGKEIRSGQASRWLEQLLGGETTCTGTPGPQSS